MICVKACVMLVFGRVSSCLFNQTANLLFYFNSALSTAPSGDVSKLELPIW